MVQMCCGYEAEGRSSCAIKNRRQHSAASTTSILSTNDRTDEAKTRHVKADPKGSPD